MNKPSSPWPFWKVFIANLFFSWVTLLPFDLRYSTVKSSNLLLSLSILSSVQSLFFIFKIQEKTIRKFMLSEFITSIVLWNYIIWMVMNMSDQLKSLGWVIGLGSTFALIVLTGTRIISFFFWKLIFLKLKNQASFIKKVAPTLIAASLILYLINPIQEASRRNKNFINAVPAEKSIMGQLSELKQVARIKCFDQMYESAEVVFIEGMLLSNDKIPNYTGPHADKRLLIPETTFEPPLPSWDRANLDVGYSIKDCFHVGETKYYYLTSSDGKYLISGDDLDFAGKAMVENAEILLNKAYSNKDLDSFRSNIAKAKSFTHSEIFKKIINEDAESFFEIAYQVHGKEILLSGARLIYQGPSLKIRQFIVAQNLTAEEASLILLAFIYYGTPQEVEALLLKGASFKFNPGNNVSMILGLPRNKAHFREILDIFIREGGDVNAKYEGGENLVLRVSDPEQIKYLVSKGADINLKNDRGWNLLLFRAQNAHQDLSFLRTIVELGADKNVKSPDGKTAYEMVSKKLLPIKHFRITEADIEFLKGSE